MKISIIVGTRPEIIKMSPIIRECERLDLDYFILHSGQHYSFSLDEIFFNKLNLPNPKYNLRVGPGTHSEQIGKIMIGAEKILRNEMPNLVLVEGDTNTVLAAALSSIKLGIQVGHVEAGLRSYDRKMPEEINRILTDHCSDFLFAPTQRSYDILCGEGLSREKIFITGNTIVDAIYQNMNKLTDQVNILNEFNLSTNGFFLTTVHRQENVDDQQRFRNILIGLEEVQKEFGLPVIYPIHPRAKKQLLKFGLKSDIIRFIEPLDYFSFLDLERNARLILTDSGGVQEESCVLNVPCVTLRYNTERPETLEVGSNVIAGTDPSDILLKAKHMLNKKRKWENPFGDGKAGTKIINILLEKLS